MGIRSWGKRMKKLITFVLICIGFGILCYRIALPSPSAEDISGRWRTVPGYIAYRIAVKQKGATISGHGRFYTDAGPNRSFQISGSRVGDLVSMTFKSDQPSWSQSNTFRIGSSSWQSNLCMKIVVTSEKAEPCVELVTEDDFNKWVADRDREPHR